MVIINVLSLCDGMSCGQIALVELGIPIEKYFASEIYEKAIMVTQDNFPSTIQCGNILELYKNEEWLSSLPKIDLVLFGFPCRNTSKAVAGRKDYDLGLQGEHSWLFYPCNDILQWIKEFNNEQVYFFCENVDGMTVADRKIISEKLKVDYIELNSSLFSAADRNRLYWTNIPYNKDELPASNDEVLLDILDEDVPEAYYYERDFIFNGMDKKVCATLDLKGHDILKRVYNPNMKCATLISCRGGNLQKKVFDTNKYKCRKLTENEYRKLQGVPVWYKMNVAKSHIYNMCGDGWNIQTIKWFFNYLK